MDFNQHSSLTRSFGNNTLEGNWYEDRCTSNYDKSKGNTYKLKNPNDWQYETTTKDYGLNHKEADFLKERFTQSSDDYINYQGKNNNLYVTTYKHAFDPNYKETFRIAKDTKDYFKNKPEELENYRQTWTRKQQQFDTTYKADILNKANKK